MSYESPLDANIFVQMEQLEYIYTYKQQVTDKITNNLILDTKPHQFHNAFENSPLRSSFFFTSNSPKPIIFDPTNDQTYQRLNKNLLNTCPSISKKLNLEEQDLDEMNEQNLSSSIISNHQQHVPNRNHKNAKGLKNLSESVYMIVSQLSVTKYKEVADRLVSQINKENHLHNEVNKDQHNIKRRVYDALNVLIAAELLRKEGKEVACNEPYRKYKPSKKKNLKQAREIHKLQEQTNKKIQQLQQKHQKYIKLQQKKNLIEFIIKRNKNNEEGRYNTLQFPLISVIVDDSNARTCNKNRQTFTMKTRSNTIIYGDVDLLLSINKDTIQMDNLLNNICCEPSQDKFIKMQEKEERL